MFKKITSGLQKAFISSARWLQDTKQQIINAGKPVLGSYGVSGTEIYGNYISEEYLGELNSLERRCRIFDRMEKTCPPVRLALLVYRMPLLSASWNVGINKKLCEEKGISPKQADEMVKFVNYNIIESAKQRFRKRISDHLAYKKYGFSISEIVWKVENNQVVLDDLEFRHPRTILWNFDDENKLMSVSQQNYYSRKKAQPIPRNKFLLFTQNSEGDNVEGVADLRYMYRPWKENDVVKRLILAAIQKHAIGAPLISAPSDIVDAEWGKVQDFLRHWTATDTIGGIMPNGWEVDIKESSMTGANMALQFKQELDREIFMSALAMHVLPVLKGSGSLALSKDASDFFGMALQSDGDLIADVYNYELIPQMVDQNFNTPVYPELSITIREEDVNQFTDNIVKLTGSGIIPIYQELQEMMISKHNLPEVNLDEIKPKEEHPETETDDMDEQKPKKPGKPDQKRLEESAGEWKPWRELTRYEEAIGGQQYMSEKYGFFEQNIKGFQQSVMSVVKKQIDEVLSFAEKTGSPAEIMNFDVPYQDIYREIVEKYLLKSCSEGITSVEKESGKSTGNRLKDKLKAWAAGQAKILSKKQAEDLLFYIARQYSQSSLGQRGIDQVRLREEMADSAINGFIEAFD